MSISAFRRFAQLSILFLAFSVFASTAVFAQRVSTIAGALVGDGGPATSSAMTLPQYAAVDTEGNIYISDYYQCRLRKVDLQGNISTIAGTGICGYSGDGGLATHAQMFWPEGVAVDGEGNVFFADFANDRIRVITPAGKITTVAGSGSYGFCGDGGPATQACLAQPTAVAVVNSRNGEILVIADTYNQRIRQVVLKTGIITTMAGNGNQGYGGDGGPATQASLNQPGGVAVQVASRSLWISDSWNSSIRRVDLTTGIITTFLGDGQCDEICLPEGISVDAAGNLYVPEGGNTVLEVEYPSGVSVLKAGGTGIGFWGDGGPATSAGLNAPWDAVVDPAGDIFIADSENNRVRKVDPSGNITTFAGGAVGDGGNSVDSNLNFPMGLAFDEHGNLFIADTWNNRVRKVSKNGTIATIAGTGLTGYSGDGGPASQADLNEPLGVAVDPTGNIYIADYGNFALRKIDTEGTITTLATEVFLNSLVTDPSGNIYASDDAFCVVWKFTPSGQASIVAGTEYNCGYNSDNIPATQAELSFPEGLAFGAGNLYISDMGNSRVRMVDLQGIIHTVAGDGNPGFSGDGGLAIDAMINGNQGIGIDKNNNLYIADAYNTRIRVVNSSGIINTYAGTYGAGYNGNNLPALDTTMEPFPLAVNASGIVVYGDVGSYLVRAVH
ncbi:MAG: SMP-30/gluconolactonase/LRE family protein [Terriglobales bacterium]